MSKLLLLSYVVCMMYQGLYAGSDKSLNTFLFCLKPEIQPLQIILQRGKLNVGLEELDDFIQSNAVVKIEPWIKSATNMDRDGDIYLNRIYRAYIDEKKEMETDQLIASIQSLPCILYSESEYLNKPFYTPNDPKYTNQCSLEAVKANLAWDFWNMEDNTPGDENILLASVDTGVDYTHPDLIENIWVNQEELLGNEIIMSLFEIIDEDLDGIISAPEISSFMITQEDVNDDGTKNLRDALHSVSDSPFMDGIDNDDNGYVDDIIGWDLAGEWGAGDNDPLPKTGVNNDSGWAHGTHVAGILSATTDNELGMAASAFNGKILSVKCSQDGPDTDDPSIYNGYDGMTYAAKAGFSSGLRTIINNSWGSSNYSSSEQAAINNIYNNYNAIILAAAGNGTENPNNEEYAAHYPASYDNVISVCALKCTGSWGGWATYHPTIDLAAPGDNIYSTVLSESLYWNMNENSPIYKTWDGSSMASPNAASVIALVWSYHNAMTKEEIIDLVQLTADSSIYDLNPDYANCNGNEGEYCLGSGMVDAHKAIGRGFSPNIQAGSFTFDEIIGDGDGVINPEETGYLTINLKNMPGWATAENIEVLLSSENPQIIIQDGSAVYDDIAAGDSLNNLSDSFIIETASDIELGSIVFQIQINGSSINYNYDQSLVYENISVTLNQVGFPLPTFELKSSPLVVDLDADGDMEIIMADNSGIVHIYNADGTEVINESTFPFDTGNQIWGAVSSADIDQDGFIDFVITSKSKHLYIFDQNGLKVDYSANQYLMGTPTIGNLDDDGDMEIVIGGYSTSASDSKIFAINPDGSDVEGFPLLIEEKIKVGVALADFDGNGKDDLIFGTNDNNVYLILDDGNIAANFPFITDDKVQSAPSILDIDGEKIIVIGCNDNNLYAINDEGSLQFSVLTGGNILTSPSILNLNGETFIFFGSNDDKIYAINSDGSALSGWPKAVDGSIIGSVVFSDLDGDNSPDIVASTDKGSLIACHLNGSNLKYFPINNEFPLSSAPMIAHLDNDGDLEIIAGSSGNLLVVDIKELGSTDNFWNMYRGGRNRRGVNFINGNCMNVEACNYDISAEMDDGTCIFSKENSDCEGDCLPEFQADVCGVCGGQGAIYECGCNEMAGGTCNCSNDILDECGECAGDNSSCTGCTDSSASNYDSGATIDDGSCDLAINTHLIPDAYDISDIYPNPFNPKAHIRYSLPENTNVQVAVYNILGQQTENLVSNYQTAGYHVITWDASQYSSGVYFITIEAGTYLNTKKVLLIK